VNYRLDRNQWSFFQDAALHHNSDTQGIYIAWSEESLSFPYVQSVARYIVLCTSVIGLGIKPALFCRDNFSLRCTLKACPEPFQPTGNFLAHRVFIATPTSQANSGMKGGNPKSISPTLPPPQGSNALLSTEYVAYPKASTTYLPPSIEKFSPCKSAFRCEQRTRFEKAIPSAIKRFRVGAGQAHSSTSSYVRTDPECGEIFLGPLESGYARTRVILGSVVGL